MHGIWLESQKLTYRKAIPIPEPRSDEALVRVRLAGICGTDLELLRGYYPYTGVPGHEFVGDVISAPDKTWVGKRVVGEINIPCGECQECKSGRLKHCEARRVLGIRDYQGVFTEYITLRMTNLHQVPSVISDDAAIFIEPLAAALEIQEQVAITPSRRVLLIGAGRLGLLIAQTLALLGCDLLVVSRQSRASDILKEFHIPVVTPDLIPSSKMDIVIDASGSPHGYAIARQSVRPQGILVLKSTYASSTPMNLSSLVVDEITLIGSRCGSFKPAINLLASGRIDPTRLIDARFPLSNGLEAFKYAAQKGVLKVVLNP